ncbi:MAG: hypothetical protein ACRDDZ_05175 [Marinifilaceae bacterium]
MSVKLKHKELSISFERKLYLKFIYLLSNRIVNKGKQVGATATEKLASLATNPDSILLTTIAFNNAEILQNHALMLRDNIKDKNMIHLIADNSTNEEEAEKIKLFCDTNGLIYIRLPRSKWLNKVSPSYSHGAAVNWVYYNIIKKYTPAYFGFLDHDLFLSTPFSIVEQLKQCGIYGATVQKDNSWYLWMGLCCFTFKEVENLELNFLPTKVKGTYLDTGGSNWYSLYQGLSKTHHFFTRETHPMLINNKMVERGYELLDQIWIHTINGSNWNATIARDNKDVANMLNHIISTRNK